MVSKLKQTLRASLRPAGVGAAPSTELPSAGDDRRVQTLKLEGHVELEWGPEKLKGTSALVGGVRFFVGAWLSSKAFAYGERDDKGNFSLSLSVDTHEDEDLLKLQVYALMCDPETKLTKPFPLGACVSCMHKLCKISPGLKGNAGGDSGVTVQVNDSIVQTKVCEMSLRAAQPVDTSRLRRSALYSTVQHNHSLSEITKKISKVLESNQVHVPEVAAPFVNGLGYLPNGGEPGLQIPPVQTHYAALSSHVQGVGRPLPHAVLAYFLQTVLTHGGLTIEEALKLPDREFARLAGDVLWGLTSDADGCPYEPDRTLAMGIAIDPMNNLTFGLFPQTSEDIGLPYAQSSFIGRDLTPQVRPDLDAELGLVRPARREGRPDAFKKLVGVLHSRDWSELCRALLQDDCETSACAGMLATNTVQSEDMSYEAFKKNIVGFDAFKGWTDEDVRAVASYFGRLKQMIRSGAISVSLAIGLAGGAAVSSQNTEQGMSEDAPLIDERKGLGGHCFAVLRHSAGEDDPLFVRLLEGTSCMRTYPERPDGPKYTVQIGSKTGGKVQKELPMSQFLTVLSSAVSLESQVVNRVIGGGGGPGDGARVGIQGPREIAGFVRPTIVTRCLHSLNLESREDSELGFYKWCLYTGLTGDPCDLGTLPLDDVEYRSQKGVGAGCRPAELASQRLRGVGVTIPPADLERGRQILSEVWPPLADLATFRSVLNLWEPLPPLTQVNKDLAPRRQQGVTYATVTCMESPASPALVEVVYELKKALFDRANDINAGRKGSDGIFGVPYKLGTGVVVVLHVPERSQVHTFMSSLKEAKAGMGWAEPAVASGLAGRA